MKRNHKLVMIRRLCPACVCKNTSKIISSISPVRFENEILHNLDNIQY
jgi:hypothetical protein